MQLRFCLQCLIEISYLLYYETVHDISNNAVCATNKASDQPAHMRSLIRAFAGMIVKLLTEYHLEFLSLKGGCRGSSESTLVKMSNCLKSHAAAPIPSYYHTLYHQQEESMNNS